MAGESTLKVMTVVPILLGAMCLTIALMLLAIGLRRPYSRTHLAFSISAIGVAGATLLQPWVYRASTLEEFRLVFKWMIGFEAVFWLAAIWFVVFYTGLSSRWLP